MNDVDPSSRGLPTDLSERAARLLHAVRQEQPLIQCLTNSVVTNFTANVLLAAGAAPAMTDISGEAGPFARIASGLLVNLGTPTPEQRLAMREAAAARRAVGGRWVLDPVAIGALPVRTALAADLLEFDPTVIRGNASEVRALAGQSSGGRGVDSTDATTDAVPAAMDLAERTRGAVAVSGAVDEIVGAGLDGAGLNGGGSDAGADAAPEHYRNHHDAALLTRVTGGGCALGAVMAAFLAVGPDESPAVCAALATGYYTLAARQATEISAGPGSFAVALLDRLAAISPDEFATDTGISAVRTGSDAAGSSRSAR
ncbi:hydroxyethylthiazole kinase [Tersicoccus sp. MR15.9]|uniref:hydroxyethylthiazole kinase n=1 Tax=Tersicoccus mangrovi TaxID=3121635 RepID=UPI002FE61424